jgi:hypothetical protein
MARWSNYCVRSGLAHTVQIGQNLRWMVGRFDLVIGLDHLAIGTHEHGFARAPGAVRFRHAEGLGHGPVLVAQQIIGKGKFVAEFAVLGRSVIAEPNNGGVAVFKILGSITEPISFNGSTRRISLGIPPKQHITPGEIRLGNLIAILIGKAEIRRFGAHLDHCHLYNPL